MARMKSGLIWVLGGAIVVLAYVIGVQAAALYEKWNLSRNADQYHAQAAEQTASVLKQMGTIEVGDTLPNFPFEDIDGKVRLLSEVVTDKTLITYLERDCEACLLELERLKQAANGQADYEHILLITSANPVHMQKLRAEYGLGCVILYDEERRFGSTLKISSFPFNLVVDRQRVIEAIHANVLLPDDYERFFDEARSVIGMVPHGAAVVNVGSLSLRAEMTPFQTGASQRGNLYVDLAERFEIATSRPRSAVETRDDRFRGFATFPSVVGVCSGLTTT